MDRCLIAAGEQLRKESERLRRESIALLEKTAAVVAASAHATGRFRELEQAGLLRPEPGEWGLGVLEGAKLRQAP